MDNITKRGNSYRIRVFAGTDKNGKKTHSIMRRFGNRSCRVVEFFIGKLAENKDPMDDMEEMMDDSDIPDEWKQVSMGAPSQTTMQEFTEMPTNNGVPF